MVQKMLDQMAYINLVDDEKVSFLNAVRKNKVADPNMELRIMEQRAREGPLDLSLPRPIKKEPVPEPVRVPVVQQDNNELPLDLRVKKRTSYYEPRHNIVNRHTGQYAYLRAIPPYYSHKEKWPPRAVWLPK